jgi:hypothetical protein
VDELRHEPGKPLPRADLFQQVGDLAEHFNVPPRRVGILISQARRELFGNLSDTGIDKALKRDEEIALRKDRPKKCKAPDCSNVIPADVRSSREFCIEREPACRVRWSRHPEWQEQMDQQNQKKDVEREERDAWILEQVEFRRHSGLTIPEIAKGLGISTRELERVGLKT